ncbi:uncharacterized protein LAESUDRAFT_716749 [Laetiporus sulphureus 93-53]|uniref:Uncharacterized protein n=1 Tax=Laetiporus sulphureus 93-53 TaxID=1314785 RepID=A0A165CBS2_9APHY|nr:uncharacterized protein LAESUDRAFT_716749 [Laetiporus sulphureus 93-53]KZT02525.1 hypothetical protein LAESUDRAFT_716749 [Laetiporus sulphureus 93-53]
MASNRWLVIDPTDSSIHDLHCPTTPVTVEGICFLFTQLGIKCSELYPPLGFGMVMASFGLMFLGFSVRTKPSTGTPLYGSSPVWLAPECFTPQPDFVTICRQLQCHAVHSPELLSGDSESEDGSVTPLPPVDDDSDPVAPDALSDDVGPSVSRVVPAPANMDTKHRTGLLLAYLTANWPKIPAYDQSALIWFN